MKTSPLFLFLLLANVAFGQVKIGDNINTIDQGSLVELESDSKVFVVTRVSTAQMNAITPLNGALVYNTDEDCLFQFRSNSWVSLCVDIVGGQTITTILDNLDGTFTYTNEADSDVIISKANLIDNGDGSYSFSNGTATVLIETSASTNPYNNAGSSLTATTVQEAIDELKSTSDAAIALKEDTANKSTDTALGTSDMLFPTQNAVKTYVDNEITATADDDITAVTFDGTDLTVDEGATTSFSANLSSLEESADITAEETRALAAEAAIQSDVDTNEADADTAITAVQADVDTNEADADAAIALKEDTANKSTDTALGTSDVLFPTQNAVKTYVDNEITATADDDITAVTFDGTDLTVDEGATTSFSANLSSLEESADITAEETRALAAEAAIQADVDTNEADADTAIAAVQADVDTNEADADAAIALKEDLANKSTDTVLGASDILFPTQNAVKTYVDNEITATADDDITAVTFDGTDLTVDEGATTSFSANLSSLEESADITAEETRALAAEAAIQSDVDTNEADADAAIALKEDTANKSSDTALGTSDVLFPTQNAVKTYVDNEITATADDDITAVTFDGTDLTVDEGATTSFSANLSSLEESADITAEETRALAAEAAIQADVDANEADADAAIALKEDTANKSTDTALGASDILFPTQNAVKTYVDNEITATADDDITAVTFDGTDLTVDEGATTSFSANLSSLEESADITAEETRALAAEAAIQSDVDTNEADADAAIALKEDTANKSTDTALGTSDVLFPTQNAVKTYVDNAAQHTGTAGSLYFAGATGDPSENNGQLFWDTTNNRLGVGTNTPSHKIQVNGQVRATSFANANGTAGAPSYRFNNDGNTGMFLATADQLGFSTAGNEAIRIDNAANVGIGTSTPDESLHVANNMRLDGSLEDKDGEAGTSGQILTSTGTGTDWTNAPYEKIVIWAEENGALANNQLEWSFGNGATGRIGIPLPEDWEAYAVSFNADVNGATDSVLMAVTDSNTNTNLFTFTATGNANNMAYTEMLAVPVAIPAGTSIGFRTVTETGNVSDARVAVFLRRRP